MIEYLWPTPVLREMGPFNDGDLAAFADFSRKARALFEAGGTQCTLPDVDMSLAYQFNAMQEPYRSLAPQPQFAALEGYIDEVYRRYMREALGVRNASEVRYVARILPVVYGAKGRRVLPHYHHTCDHVMCLYLETGVNRKPMAQRDRRIGDGELILCDPRPMASFPFWEKTRMIDPVPGLVVLHPSQVWHETNAFTSDGDRTLFAITLKVTSHNYTDLYQPLGDTPCSSKSTS